MEHGEYNEKHAKEEHMGLEAPMSIIQAESDALRVIPAKLI